MQYAKQYLQRHSFTDQLIHTPVQQNLKYILVVPCYNEPEFPVILYGWLEKLKNTKEFEIIIVFNSSEVSSEEIIKLNKEVLSACRADLDSYPDLFHKVHFIETYNLPKKHAGAGLARKIGMDEAIRRFSDACVSDGVIISLDADTQLSDNYFADIEKFYSDNTLASGCTFYFEHPVFQNEIPENIAIIQYELYLRYYKKALEYTGFPYVSFNIGSCFSVNADMYCKVGGMNRKQAGEDFYFLQKVLPQGNFFELNSLTVFPSSRISDRVPFGTGPMIRQLVESNEVLLNVYDLDVFVKLKSLFAVISNLYKENISNKDLSESGIESEIIEFLEQDSFYEAHKEIMQNVSGQSSFISRFYNWFNAFKVIKCINFLHEKYYKKQPVNSQANRLLHILNIEFSSNNNYQLLDYYRKLDRANPIQKLT